MPAQFVRLSVLLGTGPQVSWPSPLAPELSPASVPLLFLLCLASNSVPKKIHLTPPAIHAPAGTCCSTSSYISPGCPETPLVSASKCIRASPVSTGLLQVSAAASTAGNRQPRPWARPLPFSHLSLSQCGRALTMAARDLHQNPFPSMVIQSLLQSFLFHFLFFLGTYTPGKEKAFTGRATNRLTTELEED